MNFLQKAVEGITLLIGLALLITGLSWLPDEPQGGVVLIVFGIGALASFAGL